MKPDEFEQKLQRQTLRQVPTEWRGEILTAASGAGATHHVSRGKHPSLLSTLNHQLSTLLWPHPTAWAGLAAIWILILALDNSARDQSPAVAKKTAPPSPEVMVELKQQRRLLAELIGPRDTPEADRSKPLVPRPRTQRGEFLTA